LEFCLVAPHGDSRWEFPRQVVGTAETPPSTALRGAGEAAGLHGQLDGLGPLAEFESERHALAESTVAFLMLVAGEDEEGGGANRRKRRWCLPEEARLRIRRKPMRRLIDIALRRLLTKPT